MAYLDHAATTPMLPEALAAMTDELGRVGNASSLHAAGRRARRVVEESREAIAAALGARPGEVVFTAGGTEADNLAVKGLYWARRDRRPAPPRRRGQPGRAPRRARPGALAGRARGRRGRLAAGRRARPGRPRRAGAPRSRATPDEVALVTVMWANNEVGTVQPVAELAAVAARVRRPVPHRRRPGRRPAAGRLRRQSALDAMTVTGAQDRRPDRRRRAAARPRRRRSPRCCTAAARSATCAPAPSTSPAIAGFAAAARARSPRDLSGPRRARRVLRDDLVAAVAGRGPRRACSTATPTRPAGCPATRTSPSPAARATRCCCCSTPAASSARPARPAPPAWPQPSHVLLAMGADEERGARHPAVLARPHLEPRRRRRAGRRRSARSSSGPGAPGWPQRAAGA